MWLEILRYSGPVLALVGGLLGWWGTLLMCRAYHAFGTFDMMSHIVSVIGKLMTGQLPEANQQIDDAADFGEINKENRRRTLKGVYVLVFSFFVQSIGAVLIVLDMMMHKAG